MQFVSPRLVSLTGLVALAIGCGGNVVVDGASAEGTGGAHGASNGAMQGTASNGVGTGHVGASNGVGVGVGGASGVGGFAASGGASTNVDAASSSEASTAAASSSSSGAGGGPVNVFWDVFGLPDTMATNFDRPVMTTDAEGNTYLADTYEPGPAHFVVALPCAAIRNLFVTKISPAGQALWSRCVPLVPAGDNNLNHNLFVTGIAVSPGGGLALLGSFSGSVDFGAGPLATGSDIKVETFLAALDPSSGAATWSRQIDAYGVDDVDVATSWSLASDAAGNLYLGGTAYQSIDFGNDAALDVMTGHLIEFIAKLDETGAGVWATQLAHFAETTSAYPAAIVASGDGAHCALAAPFEGTADFGENATSTNSAPLVAELDAGTGAIEWGLLSTANDGEVRLAAAFDGSGALVVGVPGVAKIIKFDGTGAQTWVAPLVGLGLGALAADANGDVLFAGAASATQVTIKGTAVPCPHAAMQRCVLVGGLDANGASTSAVSFPTSGAQPVGVAFGVGEHLVGGSFTGWIDFGSGPTPQPPSRGLFLAATP